MPTPITLDKRRDEAGEMTSGRWELGYRVLVVVLGNDYETEDPAKAVWRACSR